MTNDELWQAALAGIQLQISRANFATWFKNTSIVSQENGEVVISVPNEFSCEWLQNKYNHLVFRAIHDFAKGTKEVRYEVAKPSLSSVLPDQGTNTRSVPSASEQQLTLADFRISKSTNLNPRYSLDNFVVGPFNELAHAASMAVIKNPGQVYNPLFIYGGVGLGKTHLLQAVGNAVSSEMPNKKTRYISSERFTSSVVSAIRNRTMEQLRSLYREIDVLIMDDVQFFAGKEKTQEELFHTFNALYERGKQIIFSSDRPPKAIPALEERLRSRFEGGMIADVGVPDFETRLAILKTTARELGVSPSEETLGYIASHIQRNVRELEGALNRILAFQRLNGKEPSFIEARTLLRTVIQGH
ncbi:MAG: chromosomal replication initiator protein DnaA, partial [Parcubacteria group bacterium]|nr:chromosomal replication initiator protein DnaA [Parcubacteria group bacterium]